MYMVICEVGGIHDNSWPNWLMKHAVPSVNANVSAAKVDLATWQTFADFYETGHDMLNLSAINTICRPSR